jgi:hypothetical protein
MRALVEGHLFLSVGVSPTEIELGNEQTGKREIATIMLFLKKIMIKYFN